MSYSKIVTILLLFFFSTAGWAANQCATPYPVAKPKQIIIINNSNNTIYPVIEASKHPIDDWLKAYNCVKQADKPDFTGQYLYRVYIGGDPGSDNSGIPAGQTVTVSVPFYSMLTPTAKNSDQQIDWWNGVRVDIYDKKELVKTAYDKDKNFGMASLQKITDPITGGLLCNGSTPCANGEIFFNTDGLPSNDPLQLTEYTFAGVDPGKDPFGWDTTNVDYDVSYVDDVYLPIAMEPVNNIDIGYTGSVMKVDDFRNKVSQFIDSGWAQYLNSNYPGMIRVPAAYPILTYGLPLPPVPAEMDVKKIQKGLTDNWYANKDNPINYAIVQDLFMKNHQNFVTLCGTDQPLDNNDFVQHVYGFVAFVDCKDGNGHVTKTVTNPLAFTPGANFVAAESDYKTLMYSKNISPNGLSFNPFVEFIHGKDQPYSMGMVGSYAFSIDDIVGNMMEPGDGIYIAVGGAQGLPNPNEYNPSQMVIVTMAPPPSTTSTLKWTSYHVCSDPDNVYRPLLNGALSFKIETPEKKPNTPCKIDIKDSSNQLYSFTLLKPAPFADSDVPPIPPPGQPVLPPKNLVGCAANDGWCNGIAANVENGQGGDTARRSYLNTPPPIETNVVTIILGMYSDPQNHPKWSEYSTCAFPMRPIPPNATSLPLGNSAYPNPSNCNVILKDSSGTEYSFSVIQAAPFKQDPYGPTHPSEYIDCSNKQPLDWCKGINPNTGGNTGTLYNSYVSTPPTKDVKPAFVPKIINAQRGSNLSDVVVQYTLGDSNDYKYGYLVNDLDWPGVPGKELGTVTLSNVSLEAVNIKVTATLNGVTTISSPYKVPAVPSNNITPPSILPPRRLPGSALVEYTYASGGSGNFTYTFEINHQPWPYVQLSESNGRHLAVFKQLSNGTPYTITITAKDNASGKTATSAPVNI